MPPSGIDGVMDDDAVIEAEIYHELENINLDDDIPPEPDVDDIDEEDGDNNFDVENELDDYIKKLQDQSNRFEEELLECDEILAHNSDKTDGNLSNALVPYEDHDFLLQLAQQHGCDVEEYKRKILEDIENDEVLIEDELKDFIDDDDDGNVVNNDNTTLDQDVKLPVKITQAVEEGIDREEVPVSQELVTVNGLGTTHQKQLEMQQMLKDELVRLESRYEDRMVQMKKDEEFRKDEENVREKRSFEERMWKKEELDREEKQMIFDREMADREIQKEQEKAKKEMEENMKKFELEMATLQAENEHLRREHELAVEMERQKLAEKQDMAVRNIQRVYRGYRARKDVGPLLSEQREIRKKQKQESRIKEVELEIEKRKEEQKIKEEDERQRQEEIKREKEEEKKRLEEEKRLKKEEAERIKKEEKRKKKEEKQRKKEEERQRKEEEKLKKEEEKRKREEEKRRKEEEKRRKEEEEKRQKEEEKRQKEEGKRQKEAEEKKQKDEEELKKREEKQKLEEEKKQHEKEQTVKEENDKLKVDSDKLLKMESMVKEETKNDAIEKGEETDKFDKKCEEKKTVPDTLTTIECVKTDDSFLESKTKSANNNNMSETSIEHNDISKSCSAGVEKLTHSDVNDEPSNNEVCDDDRNETPRSTHKPKSARSRPSTPRKGKKEVKTSDNKETTKKPEINADCLPPDLELLRLNFIKECLPWSKVSNEPWKLKAGLTRKPLRRPSSAKKLPTLPEDVIIQSAKVASLKMVTTVELQDLPGYNISTLGQCGGLKYLTLNHCNLITLDGLTQCKQLQYINVKYNKIEYVDLKDLGQLQYLNLSQNKLSSIHGLDNCTNLRWLDLSYNNITKLGGMDTLRRLCYINISHCQLISTQGINVVPTVQMLDVSNNHLQMLEDIDKLCLLLTVNASANNIQQIPNFKNQVLLLDVDLSNNSLCTLSGLGSIWLPVLCSLKLDQNSLADLPVLQNCLLLKELNLIENQITDTTTVLRCVNKCYYLEELNILDNPVVADLDDSYYSKLEMTCPRLSKIETRCTQRQHTPLKPRNSIETMCLSQQSTLKDCFNLFQHNISAGITDQTSICDIYYKLCDKIFNMAVEYRYIHEYGEVTFIPSAPSLPKSGRPVSARQREKFVHPKDLFENALKSQDHSAEPIHLANKNENKSIHNDPKDLFENALKSETRKDVPSTKENVNTSKPLERLNHISQNSYSNPKDLFEQALKSADTSSQPSLFNGHTIHRSKQSEDRYNNAAVMIQAVWRGYRCRKILHKQETKVIDIDPELVERIYNSAVKIQANWRGYILRKKLLAALEYAQCDFDDNDDNDMIDFGDEFDLDKFVDFNQDLLDTDWRPPSTPDIPNNYAVLRKPPSGKPQVPRINTSDVHPPNNPRRAWRNVESPLSDLGGKIPRPPSSLASTQLTVRSAVSKKEEQMAEEWGFKDNTTAHLMMQRAKKMKYNSERRQKINKLDPKQRLALFRKLEEVTRPVQYTMKPSRKTLPRKEYFQARQEEIVRQDREKHEEYQVKASRTFEWLHSQVGDHVVTDSVINQRHTEGPKYINPDNNLPELIGGGKRIHLVSSPMSIELQSVDSVSSAGKKGRRFSAGSGSSTSKLPPILPTSAPVPQVKEKMSFRNAPVNQSVGWGGGKKRGQLH